MKSIKDKQLKTAYERVLSISLIDMKAPLRWIDQYFAEHVRGFGTAEDEKVKSLEEVRQLILNGRRQSRKFSYFKVKKTTPYHPCHSSEDTVVFVDEFTLTIKWGVQKLHSNLFFTSVFQYNNGKWKCIAFHGSMPPQNSTTEDTFHVEENRKRILELEQKIEERTAELLQKNIELQIEAAIERVRTVAMAMNKLEDMQEICKAIAVELAGLSIHNITLVETIEIDQEKALFYDYEYYPKSDYKSYSIFNYKNYKELAVFVDTVLAHENNFYYSGQMRGAAFTKWIKFLKTVAAHIEPEWLIRKELHFYFQSAGIAALGFVSTKALTAFEIELLKRFRNVFHLAYKRFADIKFAKAQAREAEIQLSLEKVRAATNSMHSTENLLGVIKIVSEQIEGLGIRFTHVNFRTTEGEDDWDLWSHFKWLGSPVRWRVQYFDHPIFNRSRNNPNYLVHQEVFTLDEKISFESKLVELQLLPNPSGTEENLAIKKYIEESTGFAWAVYRMDDISLAIANNKGTHYTDDEQQILQRFAEVFKQSYTRFLDLQKAEAQAIQADLDLIAIKEAKQRAEEALAELQATQQQLVQAEKMASLGELTAGIAHEIQNPLNFVNNFSEVSMELIEEMREELAMGNLQSVNEIASDIEQNLEKIHHHGKRADGIVKGMLQHSRSGTGQKELTDINALCDEYLRLAYHGLKARDKSFNAKFEMIADPNLPLVNVMQQELGRVILNLINNAFYAVSEKAKTAREPYHPTVSVITKKLEQGLKILVEDNGNGIPDSIRDKIFQPFFTTKPTGQGTGLGLSLSYDIVKAHGGELSVESQLNAGTRFYVLLPK